MERRENSLTYKLKGEIIEYDNETGRITVATSSKGDTDDIVLSDSFEAINAFIK